MATFKEAVDAVQEERTYQDRLFTGDVDLTGELLLMEEHLARARAAYTDNFDNAFDTAALNSIRQVIAHGIRAMEKHGVVKRRP